MDVQPEPTALTESREQHSSARLHGRWLVLARVGWVTLVIFTLVIFFASLPVYLTQLQTPCTGAACQNLALLTPELAGMLKGMGLSLSTYAAYTVAFTLASVLICLVVSAVIALRRSDDRMALIVALMLVTLGPLNASSTVLAIPSLWQFPNACLFFLTLALLMLVGLLFPTGRFVPRWTGLTLVVFLAVTVPFTFFPNSLFSLNSNALSLFYLVSLGETAVVAVVQLYRYRRVSNPMQRQQIKWVAYGIALFCLINIVGYGVTAFPATTAPSSLYPLAFDAVGDFTLLLIPLSFGFAMLRSRLWDIDVLISRTLVYGALTVILTGVYAGLVIGLQVLLRGVISQDNSVVIVLSTLTIAALFQPLRKSLQALIDRRFYRRTYDAAKTLQAFSAQLSHEMGLSQLSAQLVAVIQETMQPAFVSLWLCQSAPGKQAGSLPSSVSQRPPILEEKQSIEALGSVTNTIESIGL